MLTNKTLLNKEEWDAEVTNFLKRLNEINNYLDTEVTFHYEPITEINLNKLSVTTTNGNTGREWDLSFEGFSSSRYRERSDITSLYEHYTTVYKVVDFWNGMPKYN